MARLIVGQLLFPVFEHDAPIPPANTTGEFLAGELDELEAIAAENGLDPLSSFADPREVPEGFDGSPDELAEVLGPCTDWFEPAPAAATLRTLALLLTDPEVASRLDAPEGVVDEMKDLIRRLAVAAENRIRFRLELH